LGLIYLWMLRTISLRESWMREIRTSGLTRERAP